ncbi:MAG TPA: YHS domain-containing protein [Candidatus Dormibacteraeota bacterium]|nr:YHS domain-containing protein [Candidatus Dormibacteraeota bacterium]
MAERRNVAPDEDPVCGMRVDVAEASSKGLTTTHEGREYVFCGRGCFLEFRDDAETFLAPGYVARM